MRSLIRRCFNMVEVTLAMAVVGLGVTGIMAMFPVAIQSSRDAVGDNYASELSSQFFAFIEANARKNWSFVTSFPSSPQNIASNDADTIDQGDAWGGSTGNVYTSGGKLSGTNGVFGVKSVSPIGALDFLAHVRVWAVPVPDYFTGSGVTSLGSAYANRVYVEISWPASRPFSLREKRYYVRELFNQ